MSRGDVTGSGGVDPDSSLIARHRSGQDRSEWGQFRRLPRVKNGCHSRCRTGYSADMDRDMDQTRVDFDPYAEDAVGPNEAPIDEADDPADVVPFQYSITSYGADYPVDGLVKRLSEGDIFVPPFQRAYVWDAKRASRFVESLLLGLPVPGIFLSREELTKKLLVVDGQQRLRTMQYFFAGEFDTGEPFALTGVQERFDGITYNALDVADRRLLDDSIIHATVVRQDVPTEDNSSIYHLFARLNTGGLQLTPQEIRACIFHGPLNQLLHELNQTPSWRDVFGPENKRMRDQELILRFLAFRYGSDRYLKSLKGFLNDYMGRNRSLAQQSADELRVAFVPTIDLVRAAIGADAFRPRRALNAAVFDAVMVGLAARLSDGTRPPADAVSRSYSMLLQSADFIAATETGTNAPLSVRRRLDLAVEAFRGS